MILRNLCEMNLKELCTEFVSSLVFFPITIIEKSRRIYYALRDYEKWDMFLYNFINYSWSENGGKESVQK